MIASVLFGIAHTCFEPTLMARNLTPAGIRRDDKKCKKGIRQSPRQAEHDEHQLNQPPERHPDKVLVWVLGAVVSITCM
jgi:hypothetical protein